MEKLKMNQIPQKFRRKKFDYELVCRTQNFALYEFVNTRKEKEWEVHKLRIRKATTTKFGDTTVSYSESEVLAKDNEFGTYGWHFMSLQGALNCYNTKVVQHQANDK